MKFSEFKTKVWLSIHTLKNSMQKVAEPIIRDENLTMIQAYILFGISSGKVTNVGSLCKEFGLNQGNVSTMCKNMEKGGWINRIRSAEDERVVTLTLTEKGEQTIERIHEKSCEFDLVFDKISEEKFEAIIEGITELGAMLNRLIEEKGIQ